MSRTYRTCDQLIKFGGRLIQPFSEVDIEEKDWPIWDQLVQNKVAKYLCGPEMEPEITPGEMEGIGPELPEPEAEPEPRRRSKRLPKPAAS